VYLPKDYDSNAKKKYPVIYMHDGQNLFDAKTSYVGEWNVDETLDSISAQVIVIGIEHGNEKRMEELTPFKHEKYGGGNADNYLEFLPNGNIQNQNDIYEYASDNNVFSSLRARIETKIGDGPVTSSPGAIFVKNNDGNFVLASPIGWTIADIGTGKNISQILVNEVIKGQLKPVRRMINVGFQNKNLNNPFLPHFVIDFTSVIAQDNDNFWVFERGTYECMTDIITGDWFVIKNDE
jgi:hypothetical protein